MLPPVAIALSRADAEMKPAHDLVAEQGWCQIAEPHAQHQRQRELDPPPAAIDAALDPPGSALAAVEKWGWPLPTIGHARGEKARTHDADAHPLLFQQRPQCLTIGTDAGLAGAISRAIRQPAQGRNRGDDRDAPLPPPAQRRQ